MTVLNFRLSISKKKKDVIHTITHTLLDATKTTTAATVPATYYTTL